MIYTTDDNNYNYILNILQADIVINVFYVIPNLHNHLCPRNYIHFTDKETEIHRDKQVEQFNGG